MGRHINKSHRHRGRQTVTVNNPNGYPGAMTDKLTAKVAKLRKSNRGRKRNQPKPTHKTHLTARPSSPVVTCYNAVTGKLESTDSRLDGQDVEIVHMMEPDAQGRVLVAVKGNGVDAEVYLCDPSIPPNGKHPPDDKQPPPEGCCVDTDSKVVICADPSHEWHGAAVTHIEKIHDSGLVTLTFVTKAGEEKTARLPLCQMPEDGECCYDAVTGTLLCDDPNHPNHGKSVKVTGEIAGGYVYVCGNLGAHPSTRIVCARVPLCPDRPPVDCCYDAVQGILVCDNGQPPHGLAPQIVKQGQHEDGKPFVIVMHPQLNENGRTLVWLCPEAPPPDCCFDAATGILRCPGNPAWDGKAVTLEHMTDVMPDGKVYAVVTHADLPGGVGQFPICEDGVPPDCCYDGKSGKLLCPSDPELNGKDAGVLHRLTGPDGREWVTVVWSHGGATMLLCDETCPPVFCCVNIDTMTFVCPSEPDLNGKAADVEDIVTDNYGYSVAKLSDGKLVPICGKECPPPVLCPDCPTCPPGMWMTPDRECVPPPFDCPPGEECPPGMWRDPNGLCRMPPDCPHYPKRPGACDCLPVPPRPRPPRPFFGNHVRAENPGTPWWAREGHGCEACALGLPCPANCPNRNPAVYVTNPCDGAYVQSNPATGTGMLVIPGGDSYKVKVTPLAGGHARVKAVTADGKPLRVAAGCTPEQVLDGCTSRLDDDKGWVCECPDPDKIAAPGHKPKPAPRPWAVQ